MLRRYGLMYRPGDEPTSGGGDISGSEVGGVAPTGGDDPGQTTQQEQSSAYTQSTKDEPAWLPERLRRAEQSALQKVTEALGCTVEEAKTILAERRQHDEAQKSELQKAREARERAERELETERSQRAQLERRQTFADLVARHDPPVPPDRIADAFALYPADGALDEPAVKKFLDPKGPRAYLTASLGATTTPSTRGGSGRDPGPAEQPNERLKRWGFPAQS